MYYGCRGGLSNGIQYWILSKKKHSVMVGFETSIFGSINLVVIISLFLDCCECSKAMHIFFAVSGICIVILMPLLRIFDYKSGNYQEKVIKKWYIGSNIFFAINFVIAAIVAIYWYSTSSISCRQSFSGIISYWWIVINVFWVGSHFLYAMFVRSGDTKKKKAEIAIYNRK
eukprot:400652_1